MLEAAGSRLRPDPEGMAAFFARLDDGPVGFQAFAIYGELVPAVESGDLEEAAHLLDELIDLAPLAPGISFSSLVDPEVDRAAARCRRIVDWDPSVSFPIHPPTAEEAAACRERVEEGLELLERADPDGAAEVRALVREVVFAVGPPQGAREIFDGASALFLWGGVLLNARSHETALSAAQALVHESTHNLLFGLAADDPIVQNPAERHPSPLRREPRPLGGIYHATYVLARMHRATRLLLASECLAADQRRQAKSDLEELARLFAEGLSTVDGHAELSDFGREVLDGARTAMA